MSSAVPAVPITFIFVVGILASVFPQHSHAQTPAPAAASSAASAPAAAAPAPKLTPEQRREFAALQQAVMGDAEYLGAVKRALEAQRAADSLFFAKMAKAAKPELQSYIKFLRQNRSAGGSVGP